MLAIEEISYDIIRHLMYDEKTLDELALEISAPNSEIISAINILKDNSLVDEVISGTKVLYKITKKGEKTVRKTINKVEKNYPSIKMEIEKQKKAWYAAYFDEIWNSLPEKYKDEKGKAYLADYVSTEIDRLFEKSLLSV